MKIRSGFVSNSSSSSFVIVAPTAAVEKVVSSLTPYEKAIVDYLVTGRKTFMGQPVTIFGGMQGNYDSLEYFETPEGVVESDDDRYERWESWERFMELLEKEVGGKDNLLVNEIDC